MSRQIQIHVIRDDVVIYKFVEQFSPIIRLKFVLLANNSGHYDALV